MERPGDLCGKSITPRTGKDILKGIRKQSEIVCNIYSQGSFKFNSGRTFVTFTPLIDMTTFTVKSLKVHGTFVDPRT